ncbi:MAG: GIY-YIG nuclease family protein [Chloroflexi bacterium]|nr:GIY-YIG nuclease family protein [Chloroflexota bacterium]
MKGSYVLIVELGESRQIVVGSLGRVSFNEGFYAYVGSARSGIEARIRHHLRPHNRPHWHIDYLLGFALVRSIILCETEESLECNTAMALSRRFPAIPGFGCSDCQCLSHLFYANEAAGLENSVTEAVRSPWHIASAHPFP